MKDKLFIKYKDGSKTVIESTGGNSIDYWERDYKHKANRLEYAYIQKYPIKSNKRQYLVGGEQKNEKDN